MKVENLKSPIKFELKLGKKVEKNIDPRKASCAFWDRKLGTWSDKNCRQISSKYDDKLQQFTIFCECNHLTDFGVIFDPDGREVPTWLEFISNFFVGFSFFGILLTLLLHLLVPFLHQRAPQKLFIGLFGLEKYLNT